MCPPRRRSRCSIPSSWAASRSTPRSCRRSSCIRPSRPGSGSGSPRGRRQRRRRPGRPSRRGSTPWSPRPTGSGKTLAGFLMAINRLYLAYARGQPVTGTRVVYVSPLKALAVDIAENLERPLAEISAKARQLGLAAPDLTVGVRTGDTTASERAAMVRSPAHLRRHHARVALPPRHRDEEPGHARAPSRPSSSTRSTRWPGTSGGATSASRSNGSPTSAPSRRPGWACRRRRSRSRWSPALLVGTRTGPDGRPDCTIIDTGHRRALDVALELPDGELEAMASAAQMDNVLDRIAEHVTGHRTTIVFVNTRRLAERLAHELGERLGDDVVAAHHGSLSKDRRLRVETRLRAGELKALVATASLELGIDIGPVELVCQIGSPRSIATFLQRVGRSNHTRTGTPRGRLYPLTRDELVECTGLLAAVRAGRLDAVEAPGGPARHPRPADHRRDRRRRSGRSTTSTSSSPPPIPTGRSPGRPSTRCWTSSATASRPGGEPEPPTSTTTGSTASCGAARAPGSPPSPAVAPSPSSATSASSPSPTRP